MRQRGVLLVITLLFAFASTALSQVMPRTKADMWIAAANIGGEFTPCPGGLPEGAYAVCVDIRGLESVARYILITAVETLTSWEAQTDWEVDEDGTLLMALANWARNEAIGVNIRGEDRLVVYIAFPLD